MTAEKSTTIELVELIRKCDRSADQLLRRENSILMVRDALTKMRPVLKIEMSAIDAVQVTLFIQNILCSHSGSIIPNFRMQQKHMLVKSSATLN